MLNWDNLQIFLTAVRAGNYTAAAKLLGVDRTTIGRRLERLEHQLGIPLFEQDEDGYHPTTAGRRVLEAANDISQVIDALSGELGSLKDDARSHVRLAVSSDLGLEFMPDVAAFSRLNSQIDLAIQSAASPDEHVLQRKCDVGLCVAHRRLDNLRARKIGRLTQAAYASPEYLDRRGHGLAPQDYEWIRYSGWSQVPASRQWDDIFCSHIRVAAYVDNWPALRDAVSHDMGAAFMWTFAVRGNGGFVQIAPIDERLGIDLWVVTRDDVPVAPAARSLISFLADSIGKRIE